MEQTKQLQLSAKHQRAIEFRYEGLTARAAVTRLNKEFPNSKTGQSAYDHWFAKAGLLYEAYAEFAEDQQKMMRAMVQARLARLADKALDVLEAQLKQTGRGKVGMIAYLAANSVLERTVGKADAESGKIVVVRLVDPVKPHDIPTGYNADGTPKTTVQEAVDNSEQRAHTDEKRRELMETVAKHKAPRKSDPDASGEASVQDKL